MIQNRLMVNPGVAAAAWRRTTSRAAWPASRSATMGLRLVAYLMKIARSPTTTARTPSPSANAARMMARPRICEAASGFRLIALLERPARMPMPMPGPMTPRAARPAPMCSMSGHVVGGVADFVGEVALLVLVAFRCDEDEHEREDAEDERLDQVQEELQTVERDRQDGDREAGAHAERHLAAIDVAEEPH